MQEWVPRVPPSSEDWWRSGYREPHPPADLLWSGYRKPKRHLRNGGVVGIESPTRQVIGYGVVTENPIRQLTDGRLDTKSHPVNSGPGGEKLRKVPPSAGN